MEVTINCDVKVNVHVHDGAGGPELEEVKREILHAVNHGAHHLSDLMTEILQATVLDPAKLEEIRSKLQQSRDRLAAAVQAAQPTTT